MDQKLGTAAREYWGTLKRHTEARLAHLRGEITTEQLAEALGPKPAPGTSFAEVVGKAIKEAPDGSLGAALRKSGQEILGKLDRSRRRQP